MDEFDRIARLFRPLAFGAPEALGLLDDAALIPGRPGWEMVVTQDAVVQGVHCLPGDPPDLVARKLLRANLSDLAAKGAEPDGALLTVAFPPTWDEGARALFAAGLGQDLRAFGVRLFGGDTVSTPGPFTASLTLLGWVPAGGMVRRGGAAAGDVLLVSGTIGDGGLGLQAAQGDLGDLDAPATAWLADRYRLPQPRIGLRAALRACATAAADVSDGLIADAGHIAEASGLGLELMLDALPLSEPARAWLSRQPHATTARAWLAGAGDDYEVVCTARPNAGPAIVAHAAAAGERLTPIGRMTHAPGLRVLFEGREARVQRRGWAHG